LIAILGLVLVSPTAWAIVTVVDDLGRKVTLARPAARIVSLSPHATELLYAVDAGTRLVGVAAYSDFPPEAQRLPQVGDAHALDLERILALKPDLVIAWATGGNRAQVARLEQAGLAVYYSEPRRAEAVATSLQRLATLAGTGPAGEAAAQRFRDELAALAEAFRGARPVRLFYEIWHEPVMTLNGQHIVSDLLGRCGARNVFAELPTLAPGVSVEAVLAARPEVIVSSAGEQALRDWQRWSELPAVRHSNLCPADYARMHRAGPRLVAAAREVCACIDGARRGQESR
jgi:iron complex transport system substrate-binding protein